MNYAAKVLQRSRSGKDRASGGVSVLVQKQKRVAPLCSCSEDIAIDLRVIATGIE